MSRWLLMSFLAANVGAVACGASETRTADDGVRNVPAPSTTPPADQSPDPELGPDTVTTGPADPQDPVGSPDQPTDEADPPAADPPSAPCDHETADAVHDVEVGDLHRLLSDGAQLTVVDVREPSETAAGIVAGAVLYPWASGVLSGQHDQLPGESPIYVLCRSGNRSRSATEFLAGRGHSCVHDVLGGMSAWVQAGLPAVAP